MILACDLTPFPPSKNLENHIPIITTAALKVVLRRKSYFVRLHGDGNGKDRLFETAYEYGVMECCIELGM